MWAGRHVRLHQPMTVEEAGNSVGGLTHPVAIDEVPRPPQNVGLAAGNHTARTLRCHRPAAKKVELCGHQQRGGLQPAQLRIAEGPRWRWQPHALPAAAKQQRVVSRCCQNGMSQARRLPTLPAPKCCTGTAAKWRDWQLAALPRSTERAAALLRHSRTEVLCGGPVRLPPQGCHPAE